MAQKYALIPVGIVVILAYTLTYILSQLQVISVKNHRRFWNVLLLITFLVTGILGVILTVKVNYKLSIPWYNAIIQWHVDFGIGMFFISLFHFTWHVNYYINILKGKNSKPLTGERPIDNMDSFSIEMGKRKIAIALFLLGFMTISFQIIVLREFVAVFNGNELVMGIILCNWMLLTAAGAITGKLQPSPKNPLIFLRRSLSLLAIIPLLLIFILYWLKNLVFPPGTITGLWQVFWSSVVLLLPFCMLSGMLFTFLSSTLSSSVGKNLTGKSYALESFGSMAGGMVVSFILVFFLNSFQILLFTFVAITLVILYLIRTGKKKWTFWAHLIAMILVVCIVLYFNINFKAKQFLYVNQELLYTEDTPYGNIAVTRQGGQVNFYQNHVLLANSNNIIENEEAVHYGMLQHPSPGHVLAISGWLPDVLIEVLKYNPEKIDFIEPDLSTIELKRMLQPNMDTSLVHVMAKDPRIYLKNIRNQYDVVLINLPVPFTAQLNRFFTEEFYRSVKQAMTKNAVLSVAFTSSMNYMSDEIKGMNSSVYNAMASIFAHVLIMPGDRNYFIASDTALTTHIVAMTEAMQLENEYVNSYYLDDMLMAQRSMAVMANIDSRFAMNKDFYPVSYSMQFKLWLAQFAVNYKLALILLLIFIIGLILIIRPVHLGMFTCGFAAASYEVVLMISFQIIYGYVYAVAGIIITLFMAGLAAGALLSRKWKDQLHGKFAIMQACIGCFGLVLPFVLLWMNRGQGSVLVQFIFFILTLLVSVLTGIVFSIASMRLQKSYVSIAAEIYSIDLVGSALGALLVSAFLIPLIGIFNVSVLVGVLCLLSAMNTVLKRKKIG